jgi:hypothetical protein
MVMVDIVDTVPLPEKRVRASRYPWSSMSVGQSFFIEGAMAQSVRETAAQYKRRHPGWDYTTRREGAGLRVWRTA